MSRIFVLGLLLSTVCTCAMAQAVPVTTVDSDELPPLTKPAPKPVPVAPIVRDRNPPSGYKNSIHPETDGGPVAPLTDAQTAAMLCQSVRLMSSTESAEYKPGVDAYGRAVAPADSSDQQAFKMPDRVDIPVNIDVLKTVGAITAPTPDLETNVGMVSVMKNGQVQFNGHDMTNNVNAYCAGHAIPDTPPPPLPPVASPTLKEGQ